MKIPGLGNTVRDLGAAIHSMSLVGHKSNELYASLSELPVSTHSSGCGAAYFCSHSNTARVFKAATGFESPLW